MSHNLTASVSKEGEDGVPPRAAPQVGQHVEASAQDAQGRIADQAPAPPPPVPKVTGVEKLLEDFERNDKDPTIVRSKLPLTGSQGGWTHYIARGKTKIKLPRKSKSLQKKEKAEADAASARTLPSAAEQRNPVTAVPLLPVLPGSTSATIPLANPPPKLRKTRAGKLQRSEETQAAQKENKARVLAELAEIRRQEQEDAEYSQDECTDDSVPTPAQVAQLHSPPPRVTHNRDGSSSHWEGGIERITFPEDASPGEIAPSLPREQERADGKHEMYAQPAPLLFLPFSFPPLLPC
jgi:hypothetical protein